MIENNLPPGKADPELQRAMQAEQERQENHLELIASENYVSSAVLHAQGSVLTNKYAEGYPGKRYYGGCEHVDAAESLAIERALKLFGAKFANVQPHSGSQANAAVYMATLKAGDTVLGMRLADGGHLTHGAKPSFSGRLYHAVQYGVNKDSGLVDYDEVARLAEEHRPKLIVAGFSAYSRIMDWKRFREIADSCGACLLVDMAHVSGLVAAGLYPNPIESAHVVTSTTHKTLRGPRGGIILSNGLDPDLNKRINSAIFPGIQGGPLMHVIAAKAVCFKEALEPDFTKYQEQVIANSRAMAAQMEMRGFDVVSGGTDNHMFLLSLLNKEFSGADAEDALGRANITLNKNAVPGDTRSPFSTSGLRIGTPAMTTRGMGEGEARSIADWICDVLENIGDDNLVDKIAKEVQRLCAGFPVYR
jgi:glycine hydroxymethyltransferase